MKITTGKRFRREIEIIVEESDVGYLEAIVEYCERNNLEVETAAKLVSGTFREKVEDEARLLRLLKE